MGMKIYCYSSCKYITFLTSAAATSTTYKPKAKVNSNQTFKQLFQYKACFKTILAKTGKLKLFNP
jgi:hypothetical protein